MTPAINTARKANINFELLEYTHDSSAASYGLEAAEKLGLDPAQVFKTLVVELDGKTLAVAMVPVTHQLGLKQVAKAAGAKKAAMASPAAVERATGYVLGGVSPLGQKKRLASFIDDSARGFATLYVSAGRRGLEIALAPEALATLCQARFAPLTAP
ncbi:MULTISPECIES: Cys-tRNA(Pro) deacylase [unclassified Halomonas]|uniref:Cys-tRNA(Pro) deacylase n=1 Tax=unclassified Halomonas TaxID=2609666 RepID=UPI0020A1AF83|nr:MULTISPECIES: Cys-tRNA(Pro) deacylase [unclassified Halomonas]MCP1315290.1 Cys-tRNA(Pro) deacylase [Halomonas sp. 707D7]MCP1326654.1 Cys-tRNA(Pro) deacylase [Halomonas sp. 707D4]